MEKKRIKLIIISIPILLMITALTGCVGPGSIQTKHWDHIDAGGTQVRVWGHLTITENFHNWDGYFVYDTESHEDWENYDVRVEADGYIAGNMFYANLTGLDRTTEYHYRAVGERHGASSAIQWGADLTFIPGGPRVLVKDVSSIGITSATLKGELTHLGGASNCEVFFRYGEDQNFLDQETPHQTMTTTGDFEFELTGLSSCTTIYYRAIASNDADSWTSFYIKQVTPGMPIVASYLPNDVTSTSAAFRGELIGMGGTSNCEIWFEYGDSDPNNLDESTTEMTMTVVEPFSQMVSGLSPDTTYWVRAVADNGICQSKGEIKEFKTANFNNEIIDYESSEITGKNIRTPLKTFIEKRLKLDDQTIELLAEEYPILANLI